MIPTKKELIKLLKKAKATGVEFVYHGNLIGGMYNISINDTADLMLGMDKEKFQARYWGVDIEKLRKWSKATRDYQCTGICKNGKRCNNLVWAPSMMQHHPVKDFIYGVTDRCRLHKQNL